MRQIAAALIRDRRGSPTMEFAIVLPVALLFVLGFGDLAYQGYIQAVLTGAVQKAGRDGTIQANLNQVASLDQKVSDAVRAIAPGATVAASRENYDNYTQIGPEPFTDSNHNGKRDANECYSDVNGNNQWDADPGATGQGGANDVTLYKVTVTYTRLFPFAWLIGWSNTQTLSAETILKTQPYATQTVTTVQTRGCPA